MQNEPEVLLESTVIDVDRARGIAQTALFFRAFQVKEESPQLRDLCLINGDAIGILKPCTALENRLEIAVDSAGAIIDQFEDIRDALKFGFKKR